MVNIMSMSKMKTRFSVLSTKKIHKNTMGIDKLKTDIYISKLNSYIPEFIKNHRYDGYIHQYIIILLAVYVDAFCPDDNFEKHLKDEIDYVLSLKTHSEYAD